MEEYSSWDEVECAQPTQECEQLHDESWDHVEQLKFTDRRVKDAIQT